MGAATAIFWATGAADWAFTAGALAGDAAGLRVLVGGDAGAFFGVFNAEEEDGTSGLTIALPAVLAAFLTGVLTAVLAAGLTGAADLTSVLGAAAALTFALTAVTLTVAF